MRSENESEKQSRKKERETVRERWTNQSSYPLISEWWYKEAEYKIHFKTEWSWGWERERWIRSELVLIAIALRTHSDLWSRGESNPCPNILCKSFLHVYFWIGCRDEAGTEQTCRILSWMNLRNRSQHSGSAIHILWWRRDNVGYGSTRNIRPLNGYPN